MTALTNPLGQSFAFAYYDNGWLQSQQSGGALQATYIYNARGQLTGLTNSTPVGVALSDFAVPSQGGYDGAGDRTALSASLPGTPYGGGTAYQYDSKGELTGETSTRNGGYASAFAYDGAGNPATFRGQAVGAANADDQLPGNTYDGDGAPTAYRGTGATYDPEGRAINLYGLAVSFYNGDGLRGVKYAGGYTYFLYDGEQPVCELNSSGAVVAVHTFGPDGLLSRGFGSNGGTNTSFYTWGMGGNLSQRLDAGGNVIDSAVSDGFGAATTTDGTPDPFSGFGGQWGGYTDAQDGLTLFTRRFYDPATGRFLTRDPLGPAGGLDLYAYGGNDPVNRADPSGLCPGGPGGDDSDGLDWDHLSMRSAHPGMTPGTEQNAIAGNMAQHLQSTLVNAAVMPMIGGLGPVAEEAEAAEAAIAKEGMLNFGDEGGGIFWELDPEGTLSHYINTTGTGYTGQQLFDMMVKEVGGYDNINAFKAGFYEVNFERVQAAIALGADEATALRLTSTYRYASGAGFTSIQNITPSYNGVGQLVGFGATLTRP